LRIFGETGEEYFFIYPDAPRPTYTVIDGGSVLKSQKTLDPREAVNGDSFSFMYHKDDEIQLPTSAKDPEMIVELEHKLIGSGKSKPIKRGIR
jgi:hypothetical protein